MLETAAADAQQEQAANQVSIANAITSIRLLDALDWREFFEGVSIVEAILRKDPAHTYARDGLRKPRPVPPLARGDGPPLDRQEIEIAEKIVALASEALTIDASDDVRGHVGWWLMARRAPATRASGRLSSPEARGRSTAVRWPTTRSSTGARFWCSLSAHARACWRSMASPRTPTSCRWLALLLLAIIPLSELAIVLVNRLSAFVFPPRILPKLDSRLPVDDAHRTLVVVPTLLSSATSTQAVIDNLEIAYLANRDLNVGYALLGDLRPSDEATARTTA